MALSLEVVGSNVRDFCMLERNFLSYFKFVLLLMLLSSSSLLGIRLTGPCDDSEGATVCTASLPTAVIQLVAALAAIVAAIWEYHSGVRGLLGVKAFLATTRVHFFLLVLVTTMIVATTVIYLVYSA